MIGETGDGWTSSTLTVNIFLGVSGRGLLERNDALRSSSNPKFPALVTGRGKVGVGGASSIWVLGWLLADRLDAMEIRRLLKMLRLLCRRVRRSSKARNEAVSEFNPRMALRDTFQAGTT